MQTELDASKTQLTTKIQENEALFKEKTKLLEEIQDWVNKSNENAQEKAGLKNDMTELQSQLAESMKVSKFNNVLLLKFDQFR